MPAEPVLVSIIIPCYNQARYLPDTFRSVRGQTHENWECIIVDDGSTDGSAQTAAKLAGSDPRFKIITQENQGPSVARNRGLAEARGNFIQFLDGDDFLQPKKIAVQLAAMSSTSELCLSICDYQFGWKDDLQVEFAGPYRSPKFKTNDHVAELVERWETELSIPCHCYLFDARIFREHGIAFDASLANHEDWDCWIRVFSLHPQVFYVEAKLAVYRFHGSSISRNRRRMGLGFLQAIDKQRRFFRDDPRMLTVLAQIRRRTVASYPEASFFHPLRRAVARVWDPVRPLIVKVTRALLPASLVLRLEKRRR